MRFIKGAGREPVERNSLYDTVRTFPADDPIYSQADIVPRRGDTELVQLVGTGRV